MLVTRLSNHWYELPSGQLGKDAVRNGFYGQEINITTYNLCRINMFLHDVGFDKCDIACEDTLLNPQHWDDEQLEMT